MQRIRSAGGHRKALRRLGRAVRISRGAAREANGQGMVEYALVIGLISIAAIAVLILFKDPLQTIFSRAADVLIKYG